MVDQVSVPFRLAVVQSLFQRIEREGHIQPAFSGREVREVRNPKLVGPLGLDDSVNSIQGARRLRSLMVVRNTLPL